MGVANELGRYRYVSTLGAGGMATVSLAEDTLLDRKVALKRMHAAGDVRGLARLRREALMGASVSHPNLVSIFDVITSEDGDIVIVMEYVEGETLRDALTRDGKLAVPEALRILGGVAAGLNAIHGRGIVHRDIKPANILLGRHGSVKLADLGIASAIDRTRITTAGDVLGSIRYMAPEQLDGAPSTPAIDIYALAAVAFEVLSGTGARSEPNPLALAHALSTQPPPDLGKAWPQAPRAAAELLSRAMSRDPGERPGSAGELIAGLGTALEPKSTKPQSTALAEPERTAPERTAPVARPRRRWLAPALLAAVAAAAVLAVILSGGGAGSSPPRRTASHRAGAAKTPATKAPASAKSVPAASSSTGTTAPTAGAPSTQATTPPPATSTSAGSTSAGSTSAGSTSAGSTSPAAPVTPASGGPVGAVESFYTLAASHRYADAWALADPTFRGQLGGYDSFQAGQAGDHSIRFNAARTVGQSASGATVAVNTTSVRSDGTHRCSGTVDLVPGGSSETWLLHLIHINCT